MTVGLAGGKGFRGWGGKKWFWHGRHEIEAAVCNPWVGSGWGIPAIYPWQVSPGEYGPPRRRGSKRGVRPGLRCGLHHQTGAIAALAAVDSAINQPDDNQEPMNLNSSEQPNNPSVCLTESGSACASRQPAASMRCHSLVAGAVVAAIGCAFAGFAAGQAVTAVAPGTPGTPVVFPNPSLDPTKPAVGKVRWYWPTHARNHARAQQGNVDLCFLGASVTQGWPGELFA